MDYQLPFDQSVIQRILQHRYPFLLVDRIVAFEPDKRIVGIKNVSRNELLLAVEPGQTPTLPPTILTGGDGVWTAGRGAVGEAPDAG